MCFMMRFVLHIQLCAGRHPPWGSCHFGPFSQLVTCKVNLSACNSAPSIPCVVILISRHFSTRPSALQTRTWAERTSTPPCKLGHRKPGESRFFASCVGPVHPGATGVPNRVAYKTLKGPNLTPIDGCFVSPGCFIVFLSSTSPPFRVMWPGTPTRNTHQGWMFILGLGGPDKNPIYYPPPP